MKRTGHTLRLKKSRYYHHFWVSVFFLFVLLIVSGLYYATLKVDYVWRWYRIPQYFYYQETVEIKAQILI